VKLAIMQPYLFPYLGYFQLIEAVDRFVIYDDVNFIDQGWINRNLILSASGSSEPVYFTVPLRGASSSRTIREIEVSPDPRWHRKLLKTFAQTYARAPYFREVFPIVETVLTPVDQRISIVARTGLRAVCEYLNLERDWVESSDIYENEALRGQSRILDICRQEQAAEYVNPIGGMALYSREAFAKEGVGLRFLKPRLREYRQFRVPFVPGLSVVDVMMFNSRERVREMLKDFELV
jgi:hypothetical protein